LLISDIKPQTIAMGQLSFSRKSKAVESAPLQDASAK
jgi:hypothetical protein